MKRKFQLYEKVTYSFAFPEMSFQNKIWTLVEIIEGVEKIIQEFDEHPTNWDVQYAIFENTTCQWVSNTPILV